MMALAHRARQPELNGRLVTIAFSNVAREDGPARNTTLREPAPWRIIAFHKKTESVQAKQTAMINAQNHM